MIYVILIGWVVLAFIYCMKSATDEMNKHNKG